MDQQQELLERIGRMEQHHEQILRRLDEPRPPREYYSTAEAAAELGKAEFTVREWCRHGRIRAEKRGSGRGRSLEWKIPHDELRRVRDEGLLPLEHAAQRRR